ncbi:VG15 protein [Streptomyces rubiginosohelvolus]|uniref:VG15 protein n=1 Tax=Streptomyces rubiginosohelvolus TaxID=67362 RepID=UPI0036484E96
MASTVSDGDGAADRYRRAQRGLTRLLLRDVGRLWRLFSPAQSSTFPDWLEAANEMVARYGDMSASLAAEFYDAQRAGADADGAFTVPLADAVPDQAEASLRWATHDVWPADGGAEAGRDPLASRLAVAERRTEAVTQKLVADQGRETVRRAVREDRQAVGYARAAALGACAFCRLMASRGAVYATAESAGREANERFSGDASVVKFHDDCHCAIIPVFRGQRFELSAHAQEWDRLYREYAAPFPGDQLRRFRRAIAEHG